MKRLTRAILLSSLMACASNVAWAAGKAPTLGQVLKASNIEVNGYVDTSYTYLSGTGTFAGGVPNRVYDRERSSFNLHTIDLSVAYQPDSGFGAFVQFDFGTDANVTASTGTGSADEIDVQEGYVQYVDGPLTVIGGKFATLMGAEVIESPDNLNFSRSILFGYAIAFTHTGLRATYAASDSLSFNFGINNGWDVVSEAASGDGGTGKTVELSVAASPSDSFSVSAAVYTGEEPGNVLGVNGTRSLVDLLASFNVSDDLSFVLNADFGSQDDAIALGTDAKWSGVASYIAYQLNSKWRVAGRLEYFDDKDGFRTGVSQKWKEATITLAHMPSKNVELRGEVRADRSNLSSFNQPDGTTKKNQNSLGLEAIFKF